MPMPSVRALLIAVVSLALGLASGAAAAEPGADLSAAGFAACAADVRQLLAEKDRIDARRAAVRERIRKVQDGYAALDAEQANVEGDPRLEALNAEAAAAQGEARALGADWSQAYAQADAVAARCGGRAYDEAELASLPPDQRAALARLDEVADETLTFEELSACAARGLAIDREDERIAALDAELAQREPALKAHDEALRAAVAKIDTRPKPEVEAHHARVEAHLAALQAFGAAIDARNRASRALVAEALDYDAACTSRPFEEADVKRLPAELKAAWTADR